MGLEGDAVRVRTRGGSILLRRVQAEHEAEEEAASWFVRKGLRRGLSFDPVDPAWARFARGEGERPAIPPGPPEERGGE
jgi:hypothetical protein